MAESSTRKIIGSHPFKLQVPRMEPCTNTCSATIQVQKKKQHQRQITPLASLASVFSIEFKQGCIRMNQPSNHKLPVVTARHHRTSLDLY